MARSSARQLQTRLGQRIAALRGQRGLTQEVLAQTCGISQKYLSELERGEKAPSWETLVAIAHRGFETTLATLLYTVDESASPKQRTLEDVLAGRPEKVRYDVLDAVELLLRAGERK
jgi:transcriptional regulator with XRE-family HTH domain